MNRREFTDNVTILLREMVDAKEQPIIDYALRSQEEQKRLFDRGLSKCDGYNRRSKHQGGTALDIYLCIWNVVDGVTVEYDWDKTKAEKWHKRWEELGGKPMIDWDAPHFEG